MKQQEKDELLKLINDDTKIRKWEKNMWKMVVECEIPVVIIESKT